MLSQVLHEKEGWQNFRQHYGEDTFSYLASAYPATPWILASATLDDESIQSIAESLGTSRLNLDGPIW